MTLEEAKKILKKEGYDIEKVGRPCSPSIVFTEYESPEICEAMQVVCSAGYGISMVSSLFNERKARLSLDLSENTKAPGPGEEQPKENDLKAATDAFVVQADEIVRLKKKDAELLEAIDKMKEVNPALKESASQFNDALLDEQAKKIAAYKKLHFYDTKTIQRKDKVIEELRDKNSELLGMVERMKEDVKDVDSNLNSVNKTNECLNKKVVELTKIKGDLNSWISGLYFCIHHNNKNYKDKLKQLGKEIFKLNGIIHDKNAILSDVAEELRLTKIREKNLAELGLKYVGENEKLKKELADKVVDKIDAQALKSAESALAWKEKVIARKDMALAYYEKKIAEKDEEIRALKLQISALDKRGNGIDWKRNADAIKLYVNRASRERLWNPINQEICNEQELSFIINHGGKRVKYALRFDGADIIYECSDPDKKPRIPTPEEPKHGNSREDFIKKTIDNYNRRAANLGCVGSKDGNGIFDQMVGVDIAEEGADLSGVIVICGKDFVKKFKEKEESLSEFFKNIEDEAVESMSIESGHLGGNESFGQMEAVKPSQRFKQAVCDARLELLYFIS